MQLTKPQQFAMMNKKIFKAILPLFLCLGCSDTKPTNSIDSTEEAQNFLNGLETAQVTKWASPMNLEFRELLIKSSRPIGHVDYVGINYFKENPVYKDNVLLVTVKMLMEESLFKNREYKLKAKNLIVKGVRSDIEFNPVDTKVGAQIVDSKLFHCSVFYHIKLEDFSKIYSCKIKCGEKEDVLLSPLLAKEINRLMAGEYEKSIKKGQKARGVFSSDIRF